MLYLSAAGFTILVLAVLAVVIALLWKGGRADAGEETLNIESPTAAEETAVLSEEESRKAALAAAGIKEEVIIEAGSKMPDIYEFLTGKTENVFYSEIPDEKLLKTVGSHEVRIQIGSDIYITQLTVEDTIPPKASVLEELTLWDDELEAEAFAESIEDYTTVEVSFAEEPDLTKIGEEQPVSILFTDEGGNQLTLPSKLELLHDEEAPVITGLFNLTVYIGDMIQYRKGVEVKDNRDEEVKLEIDNSAVNRDKEGKYEVTYKASDKAGNTTEHKITITVMEKVAVTNEMVYAMADAVLTDIIKEGMTNREKAYAIYTWVKRGMSYTGHTDPSDLMAGAYQGLRYRAGDCFTYCATAHVLYERAGFQVQKITRTAGHLNHYWNYVNYGEGWYHCDSQLYRSDGFEAFMKTTEEMQTYATNVMNRPDYYVYDETLHPACAGSEEQESETQESTEAAETPEPSGNPEAPEQSENPEGTEAEGAAETESPASPESPSDPETQSVQPAEENRAALQGETEAETSTQPAE